MCLKNLLPDEFLSLLKKSRKDKRSQWTATPLLESLQDVTEGYDASVASIPKMPGLWNSLEEEDRVVSLNTSETQWYHLLPSLLEEDPDEMNILCSLQNVQSENLWGLHNWGCFPYKYLLMTVHPNNFKKIVEGVDFKQMEVKWPKGYYKSY